jgi:hypothetical protein
MHVTPCQLSPHGSPPLAVHPGNTGDPRATYSPFIAATARKVQGNYTMHQ